jgi:acid phosphatase type 7
MPYRALVLAACALAACFGNRSGNLRATVVGDVSRPAARGSPIAALREACGDGETTPAGSLLISRHPYLQQVTTTTVSIGWVTRQSRGQRVEITSPGGTTGRTFAAEIDLDAARSGDRVQVWARVTGLEPGTVYCYAVHDGRRTLVEKTGFRTAPAADSPEPVRFLVFGDSGSGGPDQHALVEPMKRYRYDLIIHTGDVAYSSGTTEQFDANVFSVYTELFRNLPFFPAAGNHEHKTMSAAPFRDAFALPGDAAETWYSFDWGRVHFAALDTEADYGDQARWLDRDLARSDRPWKIVYLHKPPYSSGAHGSDLALRTLLVPVLEKHGVQLLLAGHDHDYERIRPQRGVTYVVTGGGGVGTRPVGRSAFTVVSDDVIHFVYGEIGVDEMVLHAIDATGVEFDSVVVSRVARRR